MIKLRVKEILKEKGISQKELADKLKITEVGLSKALGESGNPSLNTLSRIAQVLNVSISELFITDDILGVIKANGRVFEVNSIADIELLLEKIKNL